MERIMAIVTSDAAYGHTLAEFLSASNIFSYKIVTFFDYEEYEDFLKEKDVYLAIKDEVFLEECADNSEEHVLFLSERRSERRELVFKYQSLDVLVKEINYKLHNRSEYALDNKGKLKSYVCCGVRGGAGVTSFSLCLAAALSAGGNLLYVSFDPNVCLPEDMNTGVGDMSELIYSLKINGPMWAVSADGFIRHNKDFDYIAGVLCYEDLLSFSREEARNFFAGLSHLGRYQTIVIDIGAPTLGSYVLYEKCEKIYLIGDESSREAKAYKEQLVKLLSDEVNNRIVHIELPFDKSFQNGTLPFAEYTDTEMFKLAKKLEKAGQMQTLTEKVVEEPKNVPAVIEDKRDKGGKGRLRRLMERGFSEGFNG